MGVGGVIAEFSLLPLLFSVLCLFSPPPPQFAEHLVIITSNFLSGKLLVSTLLAFLLGFYLVPLLQKYHSVALICLFYLFLYLCVR